MFYKQLSLFPFAEVEAVGIQEWGTFKDSLRAPIHGWFTYPAGFSYKAKDNPQRHNVLLRESMITLTKK